MNAYSVASATGILTICLVLPLSGQAQQAVAGAEAVKAHLARVTPKGFAAPRTPWGHPDISGIFTNKDEANTPFERPDEWAGRAMQDITQKEFAEALVTRHQGALETAPYLGAGLDMVKAGVAIAVPVHWFDNLAARNSRPWFIIEPADGKYPPLAPTAAKYGLSMPMGGQVSDYTRDQDHYTTSHIRCRAGGGGIWRAPSIYGNSQQLVQTPDRVIVRQEQMPARVIRLTTKQHLSEALRPYSGDSVGWWDGNTLVVETTNFPSATIFSSNFGHLDARVFDRPTPYRMRDLRVIERFTRIGPRTVEWSVTFDNPNVWASPWTYSVPLTEDNSQPIHEYACHEGNFGMANALTAGRAREKKTAGHTP